MYDDDEAINKAAAEDYRKKEAAEKAAERKQIADVTRAERAYRRENNIPLSPKTNPGFYHMEGGPKPSGGVRGGGSSGTGGAAELKSIMNPKAMKKGGKVSSASKRADGIATKGKTRGRMV